MTFRPMQSKDVRSVLRIIAQVDEDDYDNAQETYRRGLRGHYVLTQNDEVIGVIGAQEAEGTDRTWWLSWTYLDEAHRGSGLGALLLEALFEQLEQWDARKIFVNTSDYFDLEEGRVYEDALAAYQRVGFVEELRHRDYYDRDETLITLGLRLQPADEAAVAAPTHQQLARPTGYDEISETEGAYYIDWQFSDDPAGGMQAWEATVREIAKRGGRVVFVGVAEDAEGVSRLIRQAGFKEAGRLTDFYEDGIDDIHFRYDLL
jgi:ribosomal protein S18 acetylase RimI-like enzyme